VFPHPSEESRWVKEGVSSGVVEGGPAGREEEGGAFVLGEPVQNGIELGAVGAGRLTQFEEIFLPGGGREGGGKGEVVVVEVDVDVAAGVEIESEVGDGGEGGVEAEGFGDRVLVGADGPAGEDEGAEVGAVPAEEGVAEGALVGVGPPGGRALGGVVEMDGLGGDEGGPGEAERPLLDVFTEGVAGADFDADQEAGVFVDGMGVGDLGVGGVEGDGAVEEDAAVGLAAG